MRIRRTINGGPPANLVDGQLSVEQLPEPKLWVGTSDTGGPPLMIVDAGAYLRKEGGEIYQEGNSYPLTIRADGAAQLVCTNPNGTWRFGPGAGGGLQIADPAAAPQPIARIAIGLDGLVTITQSLQVNGNLTVNGNVTIHGELWVGGVQIGGSGGAARAARRPRRQTKERSPK